MTSNSKAATPAGPFRRPEGDVKSAPNHNMTALLIISLTLMIVGFFNLYSASMGDSFFSSQVKNLLPALLAFVVLGWLVPIRHINNYSYIFYGIILFLLIIVLFNGHVAGGSQRWLGVGAVKVQPSEFAKIACAMVVARFFYTNRMSADYTLRDMWPVLTMVGLVFLLVFEQPDLGTAGICLLIACSQFAFVRIDRRSLMWVAGFGAISFILGWFLFLRDYQKLRIINLFNPEFDPQGSGYNSLQSLVAVGSGGVGGKGFMEGTQTQLQFLPARHTDFIFSVFAEEQGFIGATLIFILFGGMTYLALDIARQAKDTFSSLLAVGLAALIFIEFMINVAMVLGIFPVVGVPLPFFSHGGSAMLTICAAVGLLVAIHRDNILRTKDHETALQAFRALQKVKKPN